MDIIAETNYWLNRYKELYRHMAMFGDISVRIPSAVFNWAVENGEITDAEYQEAEEFFKDDFQQYVPVI